MAGVTLQAVTKSYDGKNQIIQPLNVTINDGEFMVMVGPSGCGKSTLLRMVAGLERVSSGDIYIDDRSVRRRHALLFEKGGEGYIRPRGRAKIWINGQRPLKRTALLHEGDLVRLGQVEFHYKFKRTPWEEKA